MGSCCIIKNDRSVYHDVKNHPESEIRITQIHEGLPCPVEEIPAPPALIEEILRVHHPHYVNRLEEACFSCPPGAARYLDPDTYYTARSFDAARYAAGAAVMAASEALTGTPSFALVRPPGHHAGPAYGMGFCLLNNAAIAAADVVAGGFRVAIIDWDVHHGNGTQHIFYDSDRVLYCSVHRTPFYPGTGHRDETGSGAGEGYTVNVPLQGGTGRDGYLGAFDSVIIPATEAFDPDLIIISAGQDSLSDDPLGGMRLQPADFGLLTERVCDIAKKPPAVVLEGGYGRSHGKAIWEILTVLEEWA